MNNKISIVIPCYNQTALLETNLAHLEKQSNKNFDIVILDDNSSEDYKKIISKFPDLKISYVRNQKNLGAIGNIFNSIFYKIDSPYKISLHEDDILHYQYLEKAIEILDKNEKVNFVCTLAEWFKDDQELEKKINRMENIINSTVLNKTDFIRRILDGKHIMLGSVVYRNNALNEKPDFTKYDVLCDRPFLVSLIKNNFVAIIEDKALFVRDHGENDGRFKTVTEENCLNMMSFYKDNLSGALNSKDNKKLLTFSTNNLLNAYPGIKNKKIDFYQFIKVGKKLGLINFKYINKIGIVGLFKIVFGEKIINKLIRSIKHD